MTPSAPGTQRLFFLDWLRILAFAALAICALLAVWPGALGVASRLVGRAFTGAGLFLLPVVWILTVRLMLSERFSSTHALWGDWFNHAIYVGMFTLGAIFATPHTLWERLTQGTKWFGESASCGPGWV